MKDFSASKAALLRACRFPFRDGTPTEDTRGRSANQGDEFHREMAPIVDSREGQIPDRATKWLERRMIQATAWVAKNHVKGWRAERAFAYHPVTGQSRSLGYNIDRKYAEHGKLPTEIGGSADISVLVGDTVYVWDWKTGRTIGAGAQAQLELLGLMAAKATGAWNARVIALHVTETTVDDSASWLLDDVALWRVAEQLRADVSDVDDAWPVFGSHCDNCYCGARAHCELYQLHRKESA